MNFNLLKHRDDQYKQMNKVRIRKMKGFKLKSMILMQLFLILQMAKIIEFVAWSTKQTLDKHRLGMIKILKLSY